MGWAIDEFKRSTKKPPLRAAMDLHWLAGGLVPVPSIRLTRDEAPAAKKEAAAAKEAEAPGVAVMKGAVAAAVKGAVVQAAVA